MPVYYLFYLFIIYYYLSYSARAREFISADILKYALSFVLKINRQVNK